MAMGGAILPMDVADALQCMPLSTHIGAAFVRTGFHASLPRAAARGISLQRDGSWVIVVVRWGVLAYRRRVPYYESSDWKVVVARVVIATNGSGYHRTLCIVRSFFV